MEANKSAILVCNIGNRNLKFNDKYFQDLRLDINFYAYTKELTKSLTFETKNISHIELSDILLPTLIAHSNRLKKVYLFGSDQNNLKNAKTDQDTLYAAEIAAKLIFQRFSLHVEVIPNKVFATDIDSQLDFALSFFRKLYSIEKQSALILLDAGGTPQQKQALKAAAEFVWPEEQLEIYNQNIQENISRKIDNSRVRDLILLENIISLIKEAEFEAALYSIKGLRSMSYPKLNQMLTFSHLRLRQLIKDAKGAASIGKKGFTESFFENFVKPYSSLKNNQEKMGRYFSNEKLSSSSIREMAFISMERLYITQLYWYKQDLTNFVLAIHQFIEGYVNACLYTLFGYNLEEAFNKNAPLIFKSIQEEYPEFYNENLVGEDGQMRISLPSFMKILYFTNSQHDDFKKNIIFTNLLDLFYPINGKKVGLNIIRNDIAHRGIGVKPIDLIKILPNTSDEESLESWEQMLQGWFKQFDIDTENIYHTMANEMITYIRIGETDA